MIVTAWNIGAHSRSGTGYGFKLHPADRDAFFQKEWKTIVLEFEGEEETAEVALDADLLWGEEPREILCPELGRWLHKRGLAPWARGNPPTFALEPLAENRFKVSKLKKARSTLS